MVIIIFIFTSIITMLAPNSSDISQGRQQVIEVFKGEGGVQHAVWFWRVHSLSAAALDFLH